MNEETLGGLPPLPKLEEGLTYGPLTWKQVHAGVMYMSSNGSWCLATKSKSIKALCREVIDHRQTQEEKDTATYAQANTEAYNNVADKCDAYELRFGKALDILERVAKVTGCAEIVRQGNAVALVIPYNDGNLTLEVAENKFRYGPFQEWKTWNSEDEVVALLLQRIARKDHPAPHHVR